MMMMTASINGGIGMINIKLSTGGSMHIGRKKYDFTLYIRTVSYNVKAAEKCMIRPTLHIFHWQAYNWLHNISCTDISEVS